MKLFILSIITAFSVPIYKLAAIVLDGWCLASRLPMTFQTKNTMSPEQQRPANFVIFFPANSESIIATAAVSLSRFLVMNHPWNPLNYIIINTWDKNDFSHFYLIPSDLFPQVSLYHRPSTSCKILCIRRAGATTCRVDGKVVCVLHTIFCWALCVSCKLYRAILRDYFIASNITHENSLYVLYGRYRLPSVKRSTLVPYRLNIGPYILLD